MSSQFRLGMATLATVAVLWAFVWANAASADWPFSTEIARLDPGYGGVCEECDLSGRILVGARMRDSEFSGSNFSHAVLARADATGSSFEGADFRQADLSKAKLVSAHFAGARFDGALLTDSDASDADFSDANFAGADLTGANLTLANLSGANLRGVRGLTQDQLHTACGDTHTRLPRGLRISRC